MIARVLEIWRKIDATREPRPDGSFEPDAAIALVVATLSLTVMEYWGGPAGLIAQLEWWDEMRGNAISTRDAWRESGLWELAKLVHWCGFRFFGFFLVPLAVLVVRGQSVRAQNLSVSGLREHAWIYGLAFLGVFTCVVGVSFTPEFATYYPFYPDAERSWADLLAWETVYIAQFFALEFFFRGYLLEQCRRSFGSLAIFVSAMPYVMIHFGKPMPETFGALVAGLFLGTLAMTTRSIWLGFAVHVGVALSMDVAALLQTTGLPTSFWPVPGLAP